MEICFWGAARTVTGSLHEIRFNGGRYILDCGLYQGRRAEARERNAHLPVPAGGIDAVLLSHAHIDHSGNLPTLARNGYHKPIYATGATADLCSAMLPDAAYIQQKDVEFLLKRASRRRKLLGANGETVPEPLYTDKDVEAALALFQHAAYNQAFEVGENLTAEYFDAGHLLGSASMRLTMKQGGKQVRLLFSGDVGRCCLPILRDPAPMPEADYLILESTYGNRLHKQEQDVAARLASVVTRTAGRGGRIIIPAFAVGRTQQIVYILHQLAQRGEIPSIPIFVDSPLAVNATEIYRRHPECYDQQMRDLMTNGSDPFGFSRLRYIRDVQESKGLNDLHGPYIVISASGMCEAGRILHHLRNHITDPRNTVLIAGFQAEHTLGRKIVERQMEVPIFGEPVRLRAEVVVMNELSGHADQQELVRWIRPQARSLKGVFLVHGEVSQSEPLGQLIREMFDVPVHIPNRGDHFPPG